jgi:hypothetical protein
MRTSLTFLCLTLAAGLVVASFQPWTSFVATPKITSSTYTPPKEPNGVVLTKAQLALMDESLSKHFSQFKVPVTLSGWNGHLTIAGFPLANGLTVVSGLTAIGLLIGAHFTRRPGLRWAAVAACAYPVTHLLLLPLAGVGNEVRMHAGYFAMLGACTWLLALAIMSLQRKTADTWEGMAEGTAPV